VRTPAFSVMLAIAKPTTVALLATRGRAEPGDRLLDRRDDLGLAPRCSSMSTQPAMDSASNRSGRKPIAAASWLPASAL